MERIGGAHKGNRGCLLAVFGTALVLIGVALFAFLTGRLTAATVSRRLAGQTAYALMTASVPCIWVAFALMETVLLLQFLPLGTDDRAPRPAAGKRRLTAILSAALLLLVVLTAFVSANTYTVVSQDGVSTRCFLERRRYGWEQVAAYTVDCDTDKGLSVTYTMRDGRKFEILQNTVSSPASFKERYACAEAFAVEIDRMMAELQVRREVRHRDRAVRFYREAYPDRWEYVAALIGYTDLTPEPDEPSVGTATEPGAPGADETVRPAE